MKSVRMERVECEAYFADCAPLFKRIWNRDFNNRFQHYYLNNPYGRALCVVARNASGVVEGSLAGFPIPFSSPAGPVRGLLLGDLMVRPESRNLVVARDLHTFIAQTAEKLDVDFVYGVPLPGACAVAKHAGFKVICTRTRLTKILSTTGYFSERLNASQHKRPLTAAVQSILKRVERAFPYTRRKVPAGMRFFAASKLDDFCGLPKTYRGSEETVSDFDARGMFWSRGRSPRAVFVAQCDPRPGNSRGSGLLFEEDVGNPRSLLITQAFGNGQELTGLVASVSKIARSQGHHSMTMIVPAGCGLFDILSSAGFRRRPDEFVVLAQPLPGRSLPSNLVIYPLAVDEYEDSQ